MQAGFSLGWELDVWGRLRRLTEAARAQYSRPRRPVGRLTTLIADVRRRTCRARPRSRARDRTANRGRGDAGPAAHAHAPDRGVATALDVRQAEQLLYIATGRIASVEREIAQTENALSLLLGQRPGDIVAAARSRRSAPPAVPAGLPSTLLERRPDIRQAEQELIAANAQIGAAKAEYFPRISLTGLLGVQSRALSDLLTGRRGLWAAGLGATAPIFNAGRTGANVRRGGRAARAGRQLPARDLHRASGSRRRARRLPQDADAACRAGAAGRGAADPSACPHSDTRAGIDNYLPVLDAQRNLFQGELDLARPAAAGARVDRPAVSGARRWLESRHGSGRRRWTYSRRGGKRREGCMARRMILMLTVTAAVLAVLGFVKFQQFQAAASRRRRSSLRRKRSRRSSRSRRSGPPRSTPSVRPRPRSGRDRQRRSAGPRRAHPVRVGPAVTAGRRARAARYEAGAGAARRGEAQRELARLNFERMQALVDRAIARAEYDRAAAEQKPADARVGEIARDHRTKDDPGAVLRRARHPPGQPRPVPRGRRSGRAAAVAAPDLRELRGPAAGGRARAASAAEVRVTADDRRAASSPAGSPRSIRSSTQATRNVQVQATLPIPTASCGRACSSRRQVALGASRSVVVAARVRDQLCAVRRFGLHRGGHEGARRAGVSRRAPAVREARAARAATRSPCSPASNAGRRGRDLRRLQAAQRRRRASSTTSVQPANSPRPEARGQLMRFTDLFVKRPVLAIVVNLVILIAGLQSIRALSVRQYPRSDIAVVNVIDGLRRRECRPRARVHHDAARARDRERRRHRLHRVVERAERSARSRCT